MAELLLTPWEAALLHDQCANPKAVVDRMNATNADEHCAGVVAEICELVRAGTSFAFIRERYPMTTGQALWDAAQLVRETRVAQFVGWTKDSAWSLGEKIAVWNGGDEYGEAFQRVWDSIPDHIDVEVPSGRNDFGVSAYWVKDDGDYYRGDGTDLYILDAEHDERLHLVTMYHPDPDDLKAETVWGDESDAIRYDDPDAIGKLKAAIAAFRAKGCAN